VTYAVHVENATTCAPYVTVATRTGQVLQDLGPYPPRSRQVITLAPMRDGIASAIAPDRRGGACGGLGRGGVFLHVVSADSASVAR
jgi:hypothetical protein